MKRIIVVYLVIIMVIAATIIAIPRLKKSAVPRPITLAATLRLCDFVTFLPDTFAVCDDGTRWEVELLGGSVAEIRGIGDPVSQVVPQNAPPDGERTIVSTDDADGELHTVKYSRYWPALGGPNCANFKDGKCISKMASGAKWEDYTEYAVACPKEWAFGTVVTLDGKKWVCMDRGGAIEFDSNNVTWLDFMTQYPTYRYGELVKVRVRFVR